MQKNRPQFRSSVNGFLPELTVTPRPGVATQGQLKAGNRILRCALGRSGMGINKREGDGITPIGSFTLLSAMVRTDKMPQRVSRFDTQFIDATQGWCDALGDRNYNCPVSLPYPASHERLRRDDHLYDFVIVMDYNINHRMSRGGSAIFFHLAHDDYRSTEGCVAISRADMQWLLPKISPKTKMIIKSF